MSILTPEWLALQMKEIPVRLALNYDPESFSHLGIKAQFTEEQADMLREAMAERFLKWTGRTLLTSEVTKND